MGEKKPITPEDFLRSKKMMTSKNKSFIINGDFGRVNLCYLLNEFAQVKVEEELERKAELIKDRLRIAENLTHKNGFDKAITKLVNAGLKQALNDITNKE